MEVMPTHPMPPLAPLDPLSDARALHASIAALRQLLKAQGRQLEALERRLPLARSPADARAAGPRPCASGGASRT